MKKIIMLCTSLLVSMCLFSQIVLEDIDFISPYHNGFAAVKKGNKWGFIDETGMQTVNFRNDLVLTNSKMYKKMGDEKSMAYPVFSNDRCRIKKLINGVYYYGYINTKGDVVIEPGYVNATNFKNGYALAIILKKNIIGFNEVLKKNMVSHSLEDYIINTTGATVKYLENPRNYIITKTKIAPDFQSKFVAANIVAVKNKQGRWNIYKF